MKQCFLPAAALCTFDFPFYVLSINSHPLVLGAHNYVTFLHARVVGNFGLTPISYLSRPHDTWKRLSSWDSSVIIFLSPSFPSEEWRILVPNNLPKVNHFNLNCFYYTAAPCIFWLQGQVFDFSLAQYLYCLCSSHLARDAIGHRIAIRSMCFTHCNPLNTERTLPSQTGRRCNPLHWSWLDRVHIS